MMKGVVSKGHRYYAVDGVHEGGKTVDFTDEKEFKRLVAAGVISPVKAEKPADKEGEKPADKEDVKTAETKAKGK